MKLIADLQRKKIKQNLQQSINIEGTKTCVARKCIARIQTSNIFYFNYQYL